MHKSNLPSQSSPIDPEIQKVEASIPLPSNSSGSHVSLLYLLLFRLDTSFLPQGDCVEDWDAYEALWESALDTLQVWDARKHTGGRNYNHRTTATTVAASGLPSTSLVGAAKPLSSDNACAHPILAIVPGRTHRVSSLPESSSESTSDSGAGRTAHNNNVSTAADPSHHASSHATTTTAGDDALERRELSRLSELVLETFQAPALFVAPAPMLAAFSYGRQTALVVDVGASGWYVCEGCRGMSGQQLTGSLEFVSSVLWTGTLVHAFTKESLNVSFAARLVLFYLSHKLSVTLFLSRTTNQPAELLQWSTDCCSDKRSVAPAGAAIGLEM